MKLALGRLGAINAMKHVSTMLQPAPTISAVHTGVYWSRIEAGEHADGEQEVRKPRPLYFPWGQ